MVNNLTIKEGFALLELVLIMMVVGVLLMMIISNYTIFMNKARFQATVREMGSIAQAAIDYYNSSSDDPTKLAWPQADASQLGTPYLPQAILYNPFKSGGYQLNFANNTVTVSTMIPKGVSKDFTEGTFLNVVPGVTQDQISISKSIPNGFTGRLSYDLKYLYKQ